MKGEIAEDAVRNQTCSHRAGFIPSSHTDSEFSRAPQPRCGVPFGARSQMIQLGSGVKTGMKIRRQLATASLMPRPAHKRIPAAVRPG